MKHEPSSRAHERSFLIWIPGLVYVCRSSSQVQHTGSLSQSARRMSANEYRVSRAILGESSESLIKIGFPAPETINRTELVGPVMTVSLSNVVLKAVTGDDDDDDNDDVADEK